MAIELLKKAELSSTDLVVDKIYQGGKGGNLSDDPLPPLLGVGNQGGFRIRGSKISPLLVVLTSTLKDPDWPDGIDKENGIYTYYGDNKKPGHELHNTSKGGNLLLKNIFGWAHGNEHERSLVPPILIFSSNGNGRDIEFLGLAVPGAQNLDSNSDLVAVWKLKEGKRFQNYQAKFTILNCPVIERRWIDDILKNDHLSGNCPSAWRAWVTTGSYTPLKAPRVIEHRTKYEQLPHTEPEIRIISRIHKYFATKPVRFEACAAKIAELMLQNIVSVDLTRPTKDGGRDAIGKYRIGEGVSAVLVDFALEAKCYDISNPVGVKEVSRLISRLRHRQFGIFVTTSYLGQQAYQEIKEDQHPVVIISAIDIIRILKSSNLVGDQSLDQWLAAF